MSFLSNFGPLAEAPRDLWLVYLLKLLASFAYFSSSLTLTLYLTAELKLGDVAAGLHYGGYGRCRTVLRDVRLWRLAVLMLLLVGVRSVFRHLDATLPKYMVRVFGPTAPFGAVYAINPAIIILLVPLVGAASRPIASFPMILFGSALAAVSPFWL
eukprot:contig_27817_g6846